MIQLGEALRDDKLHEWIANKIKDEALVAKEIRKVKESTDTPNPKRRAGKGKTGDGPGDAAGKVDK